MDLLDFCWTHVWWSWAGDKNTPGSAFYSNFNLYEGFWWWIVSAYMLQRFLRNKQKTGLEFSYYLSFVLFGMTDFIEMYFLTSWLVAVKGINLAMIFALRHDIVRKIYPGLKM
jgi:hypothetical protein